MKNIKTPSCLPDGKHLVIINSIDDTEFHGRPGAKITYLNDNGMICQCFIEVVDFEIEWARFFGAWADDLQLGEPWEEILFPDHFIVACEDMVGLEGIITIKDARVVSIDANVYNNETGKFVTC